LLSLSLLLWYHFRALWVSVDISHVLPFLGLGGRTGV
jgi:hypothetical protein